MRILYFTEHSDRPEAETFIEMHHAGNEVTLVCPHDSPHMQRFRNAGLHIVEHTCKSRVDVDGIRLLRRLTRDYHFDIVHAFTNKTVSNAVLASFGLPHKLIAYRGIVANVSYLDPASWMTYLNPRVDRIICVADAIRDHFLGMRLLGIPLPVRKAVTIHKGHQLSWYHESPVSLQQFGIPEGAFTIGCTANNRPRKGLRYLVDAMNQFKHQPEIHLLLIGHIDKPEIDAMISDETIHSRVHLTGFRDDAPKIIAACQTAVLPAIKREGLPKAIIEAMVSCVPPIVTNSGGSPELIDNGRSGLIVPVKDSEAIANAIRTLFDNETRRQEMGFQAQRRIERDFNHRDTVSRTLGLYRELLSS